MSHTGNDAPGPTAILDAWAGPAFAYDRHLDVLHVNGLARQVFGITAGENLAHVTFLRAGVDRGTREWKRSARVVASTLRASVDTHEEDEDFLEIVGELSALSRDFAEMWAGGLPPSATGEVTCWPRGTRLDLSFTMISLDAYPGTTVCMCRAKDTAGRALLRAARGRNR